jgi:hypothetical protein
VAVTVTEETKVAGDCCERCAALTAAYPDLRLLLRMSRETGRLEERLEQARLRDEALAMTILETTGIQVGPGEHASSVAGELLREYRERLGELSAPEEADQ